MEDTDGAAGFISQEELSKAHLQVAVDSLSREIAAHAQTSAVAQKWREHALALQQTVERQAEALASARQQAEEHVQD